MTLQRPLLRCSALLALLVPAALAAQETRCDRGDIEVSTLSFAGNTAFTDAELAAGIVTTPNSRARRLLRFVGARHCLDQKELPLDLARLRLWYRNHGFTDVTVDTVIGTISPRRVEVRFLINEGLPTVVDTLTVQGLDDVPERSAIIARLPARRGGWFDRYANAASRDSITRRLRNNGYPDAETYLGYDVRRDERLATVVFTVNPGPRRRIGQVLLTQLGREDGGEPQVRETAVRRLTGLEEGDLYRERLLERAKRTLYQSEAFSQVSVEPGDELGDTLIAVNVEVREGYQRAVRVGGGWGTLDCFRTTGDISNHSLFRTATRLDLRARVSKIGIGAPLGGAASLCPQAQDDIYSRDLNYYTGATLSRPTPLTAGFIPTFSLYSERRSEYNAYLRTTPAGGAVNLTKNVNRRSTSMGYSVEFGRTEAQPALYCAVFNACEAEDRDNLQRDVRLAVVSLSQLYDRTDDALDPTRGSLSRIEYRFSAPFIGSEQDVEFNRLTLDGSRYFAFGGDVVLALRMRLGAVFGRSFSFSRTAGFVPPQERLFAGGPQSVRGFRQNELGPSVYIPTRYDTVSTAGLQVTTVAATDTVYLRANAEEVNERAVPTGGNTMIVGNAELRITSPFLPTVLKWAMFMDVGELWNRGAGVRALGFKQMKWTPGLGLRVRTPIGYLRADLAYNAYQLSSGAAYFDAPVLAGGAGGSLYCVSPTNTLPATLQGGVLTQEQGTCPSSYQPGRRSGFFGRWTPSIAIGQAF